MRFKNLKKKKCEKENKNHKISDIMSVCVYKNWTCFENKNYI